MVRLSCICIPDKDSMIKIGEIMRSISNKANSTNALKFEPHFTIRGDFKIKAGDINAITQDIDLLCRKTKRIKLRLSQYGSYPWKIIYLDIKKNKPLQALHNECMDIINKYRSKWIPDALRNNSNYKGKQLKYIKRYGYHFAYEFYSPHFTVAGNDIEDRTFQRLIKQLKHRNENITCYASFVSLIDRDNDNKQLVRIRLKD